MKIRIMTIALAFAIANLAAISAAQAQPSCAIVSDPLIVLVGTWTFDMDGFAPPPVPFAAAGQFTASIPIVNGAESPTLSITQSTSGGLRQEVSPGKYQIFNDCSGGTLTFNTDNVPHQFDFWFDEFYGEIRFVSTTSGVVIVGRAERLVVPDPAPDPANLVPADKLAEYLRWSASQREHHRFHHLDTKQADNPTFRNPLSPDRHQ